METIGKQLYSIARSSFLVWIKTPFAVASALIPTAGLVFVLIMLSLSVTQQPVALVILDHGPQAQKMAHIIEEDKEAYMLDVTSAHHAQVLLAQQQVAGIIVIPADFDDNIINLGEGSIILQINNLHFDYADDIRRTVGRSIAQFSAPQLGIYGESVNSPSAYTNLPNLVNPYHINLNEIDLRQTTVDFLHYQVIPAFILLILSIGMIGTAYVVSQEKESKVSRYIATSPISSWKFLIGRLLGGFCAVMLILIPTFLLTLITGVTTPPPLGYACLLFLLFSLTALCANGIGILVGTLIQNPVYLSLVCNVLAAYLFFLGGGFTTIAFLPQWIQTISVVNPMRYAIDGVRELLFYPRPIGIPQDILIIALASFISLGISMLCMRTMMRK